MIKSMVDDLLDGKLDNVDTEEHYIYIVRDDRVTFYIGQSRDPINRLQEHLGEGYFGSPSRLGQLIRICLPESRTWQIELLTPGDCGESGIWLEHVIDKAERNLIKRLRPCLNDTHNPNPTPLPKTINDIWEAEQDLTDAPCDHLGLEITIIE